MCSQEKFTYDDGHDAIASLNGRECHCQGGGFLVEASIER